MKINSFETGFSGHHHMINTILKTKFEKFEPKKLIIAISKNLTATDLN